MVAVFGAAIGLAVLDVDAGFGTWVQLRTEAAGARGRVRALEREVASLESQVAALQGDPSALERAIREDLELVQPGEWVVRFAPRDVTSPRFR